MPQTKSAIPFCRERTEFGEYFSSLDKKDYSNGIIHETPSEPKFVSQRTTDNCDYHLRNNSGDSGFGAGSDDEEHRFIQKIINELPSEPNVVSLSPNCVGHFSSQVTESDNGFRAGSDDKDNLNSELSSKQDCYPNIITAASSVFDDSDSLDFWNKSSIKANNKNHSSNKKSFDNLSSNCSDYNTLTVSSDDVGSFLNLLSSNLHEKYSDSESNKNFAIDSCYVPTQFKKETANCSDSQLNFYELLNDISDDKYKGKVNSVTDQNNLFTGKTHEAVILPDECSNLSDNLFPDFDNTYSDLLTSLYLDNNCNNGLSKLNSTSNIERNDFNSDKFKKSSEYSIDSRLSENDASLSDLLASIYVGSNDKEKNKASTTETLSNETGLKNGKSNEIDSKEISLASLAEEYLSSGVSNFILSTSQKNEDCINISENISVNLEKTAETYLSSLNNDNSQDLYDMCNLFAAINTKEDNTYLNDTASNLLVNSKSNNLKSQTVYSPNKNADESSEDETDGEIDLTSCLKFDNLPSSPSKSLSISYDKITQDGNSDMSFLHSSHSMLMKNATEVYSLLLKSKRTNAKQSLFAKALSCKPNKDKSAMLKVLSVQKQFCARLFNPPRQAINTKPIKPVVYPATDFVFSTLGRRIFEHGKAHEVK